MNEKELLYETVMNIGKLNSLNKFYIAGLVQGMITRQQVEHEESKTNKEVS